MTSTKPWDIYADQLMHKGFGYPLWVPDQPRDRGVFSGSMGDPSVSARPRRGVFLGDVGWLNDGEFHVLFNALEPSWSDAQPHKKVPVGFVPLDPKGLIINPPRVMICQSTISNGATHARTDSGGGQVGKPGIASLGLQLSFTCSHSAGAILMPHPAIKAHDILSLRKMEDYVTANFTSWVMFATDDLGVSLKPEDIHFVFGTKKAVRWMVAAFQGEDIRGKSGSITAAPLGTDTASLNLAMHIEDRQLEVDYQRHGPPERITSHIDEMFKLPLDTPVQSTRGARAKGGTAKGPEQRKTKGRDAQRQAKRQTKRDPTCDSTPPGATPDAMKNEDDENYDQCLFIHSIRFKKRSPFVAMTLGTMDTHRLATFVPADEVLRSEQRKITWRMHVTNVKSKIKRCLLSIFRLKRSASVQPYHHPPPHPNVEVLTPISVTEEPARISEIVENRKLDKTTDPVAWLLEYILLNAPAVETAVTSTLMVDVLLGHAERPKDFEEAFSRLRPEIHVDANGVGSIVCDHHTKTRYAWDTKCRDEGVWSSPLTIPCSELVAPSPADGLLGASGRRLSLESLSPQRKAFSPNKGYEAALDFIPAVSTLHRSDSVPARVARGARS